MLNSFRFTLLSVLLAWCCGAVQAEPAKPADLVPVWRFDAGAEIRATPVVAGSQLFVAAENGNLYALDLPARKLQWLYHAQGGISSTPAVAGGIVYFLSRDARLHAVDAATGAPLWQFATQGEATFAAHGMYGMALGAEMVSDPWDFYLSSPLVHDGKVYFGSSDQRVYALDAHSGKLLWAFKTGGVVHSSPALAGPNIVVGSWDGAVYALDAASGEQRWRFQTQTEQKQSIMLGVQASPRVDDGAVYVGSRDGFFYALDAASGALRWRHDAKGSWVVSGAALGDRHVYFGTSDTGLVMALDKRTGKEAYRYSTAAWTFATPLLHQDLLVAAAMNGTLHVLDAASGKLRWRYRTSESAADAHRILVPTSLGLDSQRLYGSGAHTLHSGMEHVKRLGAIIASPTWHGEQLIVATAMGEVLLFEPRAGKAR